MKFEVGDAVIGQNFTTMTDYNDMEGLVVGGYAKHMCYKLNGEYLASPMVVFGYDVEWMNGKKVIIEEHRLRKKKPPKESKDIAETRRSPITWDDCHFKPEKVEA